MVEIVIGDASKWLAGKMQVMEMRYGLPQLIAYFTTIYSTYRVLGGELPDSEICQYLLRAV